MSHGRSFLSMARFQHRRLWGLLLAFLSWLASVVAQHFVDAALPATDSLTYRLGPFADWYRSGGWFIMASISVLAMLIMNFVYGIDTKSEKERVARDRTQIGQWRSLIAEIALVEMTFDSKNRAIERMTSDPRFWSLQTYFVEGDLNQTDRVHLQLARVVDRLEWQWGLRREDRVVDDAPRST